METISNLSPVLKVAVALAGVIAAFVAIKVGEVVMKLVFGLIGLALLGGAGWCSS
jgi:hypothetical protein